VKKAQSILILGGARSGKSRFALSLAKGFSRKAFIATLEPLDLEMEQKIKRHQQDRGKGWDLIEEPLKLNQALNKAMLKSELVIVDCITLWISNLLLKGKKEKEVSAELEKLCQLVARPRTMLILVSNEVGQGIVPSDPLSRKFRDWQGKANQMLAQACDEVYLLVAGLPVKLKGGK